MPAGPADHPDNARPQTIAELRPRVHVAALLLEQHEKLNPRILRPFRDSLAAFTPDELAEIESLSPRFVAAARRHGIWPPPSRTDATEHRGGA